VGKNPTKQTLIDGFAAFAAKKGLCSLIASMVSANPLIWIKQSLRKKSHGMFIP